MGLGVGGFEDDAPEVGVVEVYLIVRLIRNKLTFVEGVRSFDDRILSLSTILGQNIVNRSFVELIASFFLFPIIKLFLIQTNHPLLKQNLKFLVGQLRFLLRIPNVLIFRRFECPIHKYRLIKAKFPR